MRAAAALLISCLLALLLCACADAPVPTSTARTVPTETTVPETAMPTTVPTEPPVYVYEGAVEDYLEFITYYTMDRTVEPEFVMIHFMSAVVNHPDDPYNMEYIRDIFEDYGISVHYIIDRDGTVYCYIPEDRAAYHAGNGEYGGDERLTNMMNQYAIGIELVAIGSEADMAQYLTVSEYRALTVDVGFTDAQYASLQALVADICLRSGIPMDRDHVIGHEDYSPAKTDPGELFDWDRLLDSEVS